MGNVCNAPCRIAAARDNPFQNLVYKRRGLKSDAAIPRMQGQSQILSYISYLIKSRSKSLFTDVHEIIHYAPDDPCTHHCQAYAARARRGLSSLP